MLGESDRESKLHITPSTALTEKSSGECFSSVFEKTRRGFQGPLKTIKHTLFKGLHKRSRLLKQRAQTRTQMRALCPPERKQAHTLTQALTLGLNRSFRLT